MICPNCKNQISDSSKFCPICGITVQVGNDYGNNSNTTNNYQNNFNTLKTGKKSPILALVLSLLIVGLGQLYLGKASKGLLMFGLAVFFSFISLGIGWFAVAIWSAVDAYNTAKSM